MKLNKNSIRHMIRVLFSTMCVFMLVVSFQNCDQGAFQSINSGSLQSESLNNELDLPKNEETDDAETSDTSVPNEVDLNKTFVGGATYYVATDGNDSNPGTSSKPWRNPQKCAESPIRAGDTCIVRDGTYTDANNDGMVVYVRNSDSAPSGTASARITIKSEKPRGAKIVLPNNRPFSMGFNIYRPYYVIEGFDISGGSSNLSYTGSVGIQFRQPAIGGVARLNNIHHIGQTSCTNSNGGFSGITVLTSSILIERNRIYSVGRRRNGESGCGATIKGHDHGIYVTGASNTTIRRNVIYDVNSGNAIHVYRNVTTNLNILHNTMSGGFDAGHIRLASTINTANIKNNISNNPPLGMFHLGGLTASKVVIANNMVTSKIIAVPNASGVSFSNNLEKISNLGFVNLLAKDFRLSSSSLAINRGTTSGVSVVPDGKPDIGTYEYSVQNNTASPLTPMPLKVP